VGDKTGIAWTDATWNPVVGCDQVSPGCAHCYAKTLHDRRRGAYLAGKDVPEQYAMPFEHVQLMPDRLALPLHWRTPRRIFVNSVSDLFHEAVPFEFIDKVFAIMALTPQHTYQVLTKRPERMLEYTQRLLYSFGPVRYELQTRFRTVKRLPNLAWPLPNVWLGMSVENQHWADIRVPLLLRTPAAVRFLSCEPLLGPIQLEYELEPGGRMSELVGAYRQAQYSRPALDWIIAGGESGPGFRAMDPDWARSLRDQCVKHDVAFFYKQPSGLRPEMSPDLDGNQWHQFPGDLAVPLAKGA
jgi:protein gp37